MVYPIIGLPRPLYPFQWSIWSFKDPWKSIGGHSLPRNRLWNPKKIWYIKSLGYQNPYISSHGPFDPLGTLEKWLEIVPHFRIDFGTQCTSLRKFDNHWAIGPLNPFPWSIWSFRDLWKVIEGCSLSRNRLWNPRHILKKISTSNPRATRTPISLLMVHLSIWKPLGSDWMSFPTLEWTLEP